MDSDERAAHEVVLRALQIADQVVAFTADERDALLAAQSEIGARLGLCCTDEPGDHNRGTCPVHEWLDPEDYYRIEDRLQGAAGRRQEGP